MLSTRELLRVDNTLDPERPPKALPLPLFISAISAVDYIVISP